VPIDGLDWDVGTLTRDFIDTNWDSLTDSTGAAKPGNIDLRQDRKGVDYTNEYVLVSETSTRTEEWVDGPRDVKSGTASAFVEVATPQSRARLDELWSELVVLAEGARKRSATPGTPGDWDTVDTDAVTIPDDAFNWWAMEMEWRYEVQSRTA